MILKKNIDASDPMTQSKPENQVMDWTGSENYALNYFTHQFNYIKFFTNDFKNMPSIFKKKIMNSHEYCPQEFEFKIFKMIERTTINILKFLKFELFHVYLIFQIKITNILF